MVHREYEEGVEIIQRLLTYIESSMSNCPTGSIGRTRHTQEVIDNYFNNGIINNKEREEYTEQLKSLVKKYILSCECKKRQPFIIKQ